MFSGCTVPPDSKETELGSSDQEASPSAGKNTGIVLVPCHAWKCVPTAIFSGVDIFEISLLIMRSAIELTLPVTLLSFPVECSLPCSSVL